MTMTRNQIRALELAGSEWARAARAELTRRAVRDASIQEAASEGANASEIARAVGIERSVVWRIIAGQRGAAARKAIRPNR